MSVGSIQEIACVAGVSASLVSRVLRGKVGRIPVSPATRRRILDAAAQANYTPDARASVLRTRKSGVIGVLAPRLAGTANSVFYNALAAGLAEKQREMMLGIHLGNMEMMRQHVRMFRSYRTQAVLAVASGTGVIEDEVIEDLRRGAHECGPMICLGDLTGHAGTLSIVADHAAAARNLLRVFRDDDIRCVRLASCDGEYSRFFTDAFMASAAEFPGVEITVLRCPAGDAGACDAAMKDIPKHPTGRRTVLVTESDGLAVEMLFAAQKAGLSVPASFGLVSWCSPTFEVNMCPALTALDTFDNDRLMAEKALEWVAEIESGRPPEVRCWKLPAARLAVRESYVPGSRTVPGARSEPSERDTA